MGCGFPVKFEFPPLPGKPSSVCLATESAYTEPKLISQESCSLDDYRQVLI